MSEPLQSSTSRGDSLSLKGFANWLIVILLGIISVLMNNYLDRAEENAKIQSAKIDKVLDELGDIKTKQAVFEERLKTLESSKGITTSSYHIDPAKDEESYSLPKRKNVK